MAMEGFRRNAVGPPEWECEAMGSLVWVQNAISIECVFNLSIPRPRIRAQFVVGHTMGQQ